MIRFGKLNKFNQRAVYIQIRKVRIGCFYAPLKAMTECGYEKIGYLGWMAVLGPFQVCYYRHAEC